MQRAIYLDHHASTPCDPRVVESMLPFLVDCYANPSSTIHGEGRRAANAVESARAVVATTIGASPGEVIFTSGATESNNLAILGAARAERSRRRRIVVSAIEHKCVLNAAKYLGTAGWDIQVAPVLSDGTIDLGRLVDLIDDHTALVSIQAASNEIGTIQPIEEIAQVVHRMGAVLHCDAAQALGRIGIDVGLWDVDLLSVSSHKVYGPKGVGALYIRGGARRAPLEPLMYGGGQEAGLRSGTLNVPGIVGFARAAEIGTENRLEETARIQGLRDYMESRILSCLSNVRRNGALQNRLAGNSSLTFTDCDADALLARLPEFALSTGSACSSGAIEPSHVLSALGLSRSAGHQTLRVGLGRFTASHEIELFCGRLLVAVTDVRELSRPSATPTAGTDMLPTDAHLSFTREQRIGLQEPNPLLK
jgi:cysteine desulfurase